MRTLWALAVLCFHLGAAERYSVESKKSPVPLAVLKDETGGLEASIAPGQGGELCGLRYRYKGEWVELIYRACDYTEAKGWRGKAPLLWPAVGGTFGEGDTPGSQRVGTYAVGGKKYKMPFHGFVQNVPWTLSPPQATGEAATARVSLRDTAKTREPYPFGWLLAAEYRVAAGKLAIVYTVTADKANQGAMPFAIGNHITFNIPLVRGSDPARMHLASPARHRMSKDLNNVPTGGTEATPYRDAVDLGDFTVNPAVSLGGYEEDPAMILTDPQGLRVRLSHTASRLPKQPFVQFNMWGDPGGGYFCPEPWVGLQNGLNLKQGIVELAPGDKWTWTIEIEPSVAR